MDKGWFQIPWLYYGLVCILVAIVYALIKVPPSKTFDWHTAPVWQSLILRWMHSLVWILLAVAAGYMEWKGDVGIPKSKVIAFVSLVFYVIYLLVYNRAK